MKTPISVDVISDVVCPWCFIGKRRLARAMAQRPDINFDVRFRPFRLDPTSLTLKGARLSRGATLLSSGLDLTAEAAIGLAIIVVYFRNRGTIAVEDINLMKG